VGFPGSRDISNAELLELDTDILIPAAMENQITAANAGRIQARLIAEGANGPTTPEADEILYANGKFLIPDILCNAGGVTVSYFEWVQNLDRDLWSIGHVNDKLHEIMTRGLREHARGEPARAGQHEDRRLPARVQRVADATSVRGLLPVNYCFANPFAARRSPSRRGPLPILGAGYGPGVGEAEGTAEGTAVALPSAPAARRRA